MLGTLLDAHAGKSIPAVYTNNICQYPESDQQSNQDKEFHYAPLHSLSGRLATFTSIPTKTRITTITILIILPICIGLVTKTRLLDRSGDFLVPARVRQLDLVPKSGKQVVFDRVRDRHGAHDPVELLCSPQLPQHNRAEIP